MDPATSLTQSLAPLDRPGPLRSQVREALIELIINRQLAPGVHLVEKDIAERLGVSRQPIREAFQALAGEGWVDLRPGRGAFVHLPTEAEADQVFEVRVLLEERSAALAAANATDEHIAHLRQLCVRGRRAVTEGDVDAVVAANAQLHRYISSMSGNGVLAGFVEALDRRVRWYFTPIAATRGLDSWDEHDRVVDALAAHDARAAGEMMRRHTERSTVAYRELVGRGGE